MPEQTTTPSAESSAIDPRRASSAPGATTAGVSAVASTPSPPPRGDCVGDVA
jgi:hypothetical protein